MGRVPDVMPASPQATWTRHGVECRRCGACCRQLVCECYWHDAAREGGRTVKGIVLSLCDRTGNMVRPWLDAGYECWIVDLQHEPGDHRDGALVRVGADVREWLPPLRGYAIAFAFPPCTHLAVSGARWFRRKGLRALSEAIDIFGACVRICEWAGAPWMVENPVSVISSHFRKPDHTFDPCDYGDPWTKKTCLWTGGGFVMPPKRRGPPLLGSRMHRMGPSPDRGQRRSETPAGFAEAVFGANGLRSAPAAGTGTPPQGEEETSDHG